MMHSRCMCQSPASEEQSAGPSMTWVRISPHRPYLEKVSHNIQQDIWVESLHKVIVLRLIAGPRVRAICDVRKDVHNLQTRLESDHTA